MGLPVEILVGLVDRGENTRELIGLQVLDHVVGVIIIIDEVHANNETLDSPQLVGKSLVRDGGISHIVLRLLELPLNNLFELLALHDKTDRDEHKQHHRNNEQV